MLYDIARISSIVCQNEGESSKNGFNHILSIELYLGCLDKLQFAGYIPQVLTKQKLSH